MVPRLGTMCQIVAKLVTRWCPAGASTVKLVPKRYMICQVGAQMVP